MKLPVTLTVFCLLTAGGYGAEEKRQSITLHPVLSIPISGFHISYEASPGLGRWGYEVPLYFGYNEYYDNPLLFLGGGAGFRRYLFASGRGAYVSPQIEMIFIKQFESGTNTSASGGIYYASLRMGYKFLWEYFTLDMGVGASYVQAFSISGTSNDVDDSYRALTPGGNLALGIPF